MQMVYEQDVDLGFNWQHISSPAKQMKENIQGESNNILVSWISLELTFYCEPLLLY